jgi:hypothetical protein
MHPTQKLLLKRLVRENNLRYSQLTEGHDAEDNILYHLKSLVQSKFVGKNAQVYNLTPSGLRKSGEFELEHLTEPTWKSTYLSFIAHYEEFYLVRRKISATSEFTKLPGGKPLKGQSVDAEINRLFSIETGLDIPADRFSFDCTHLKIQKTSAGEILFDDAMYVYKVELTLIEFEQSQPRKSTVWIEKDKLKDLPGMWPEIGICIFRDNWEVYKSYEFVNDYNL